MPTKTTKTKKLDKTKRSIKKRKQAKKPKHADIFELLKNKSYYSLDMNNKRLAKHKYNSKEISYFTYSLYPETFEILQPGVKRYIAFIDSRRADCYSDLKKYLEDNGNIYNSFFTIGDSDFVILFATDKSSLDKFYEKLCEIHRTAPFENKVEELFQIFEIKKYYILSGKKVETLEPNYTGITGNLEKLSKIDITIRDYVNTEVVKKFGNDNKKVKSFLMDLEARKILHNYYIIRNFMSSKIRAYVLILYAEPGYNKYILNNDHIRSNIIDFCDVIYIKGQDDFYGRVNSVIVGEFNNIQEYHEWKEILYKILLKQSQNINAMTFIIEDIISELPFKLKDYMAFHNLFERYLSIPEDKKIIIGNPLIGSMKESNILISMDIRELNGHGLIIGEPNQGKTTTAVIIAKRLRKKDIKVHIIDSTGGLKTKLEEYISKEDIYYVNIQDEIINDNGFNIKKMPLKINIYIPQEKDLSRVTELLLKSINFEDTKGRETTDVIMIEEAHGIFKEKAVVELLFSKIRTAGRQGVSIFLSTHALSDLPTIVEDNKNHYLSDYLKNKIIHKISDGEVENVLNALSVSGEATKLFNLDKELTSLTPGQVFLSLPIRQNGGAKQLPPVRVEVNREDS